LDAYQQNLLVLHSLKLATLFLIPNGIFVTKVFRSQDYNSLLWVFQQLFEHVEATKPSSSRQVSAEIFVVCRNYKAPKKIDPKLLDPKHVFKDLDESLGELQAKEKTNATLNDLLHPEKKKRNRSGYTEGDYTLYHPASLTDFIENKDAVNVLARSTEIVVSGKKLLDLPGSDVVVQKSDEMFDQYHAHVNEGIQPLLSDLKVLGKKDFRDLLRWRDQVRRTVGLEKSKKGETVEVEPMEIDPLQELEELSHAAQSSLKAAAKLSLARKKRHLLKLSRRSAFTTPADIGIEASEQVVGTFDDASDGLFRLSDLHHKESSSESESESDSESDYDEKRADELDLMYRSYLDRKQSVITHVEGETDAYRLNRDEIGKLSKQELLKRGLDKHERYEAWYGIEDEVNRLRNQAVKSDSDSDSLHSDQSDSDQSDGDDKSEADDLEMDEGELSTRAQRFFDNPLFQNLAQKEDSDEDIKTMNKMTRKERRNLAHKTREQYAGTDKPSNSSFETVPAPQDDSDDDFMLDTPQAIAMAQQLVNGEKSRMAAKRDLVDDSFHRYSGPKEDLPTWFVDDERRHRQAPQAPLTKEAVQLLKSRLRAISAAPIKKIAEAKARKRLRAMQKLKKVQEQMGKIWDDEDAGTTELAKAKEMQKLQRRAMRGKALAAKKEKPKLVVAKGGAKGNKGRPKGVKGRFKMVDGRMKKDARAVKANSKRKGGRR
jgi:AdoMet-dependent rRNA methyltransferase SPB1